MQSRHWESSASAEQRHQSLHSNYYDKWTKLATERVKYNSNIDIGQHRLGNWSESSTEAARLSELSGLLWIINKV